MRAPNELSGLFALSNLPFYSLDSANRSLFGWLQVYFSSEQTRHSMISIVQNRDCSTHTYTQCRGSAVQGKGIHSFILHALYLGYFTEPGGPEINPALFILASVVFETILLLEKIEYVLGRSIIAWKVSIQNTQAVSQDK